MQPYAAAVKVIGVEMPGHGMLFWLPGLLGVTVGVDVGRRNSKIRDAVELRMFVTVH